MVFQQLAIGQKPDDSVMGRVLKAGDQCYRFISGSVYQHPLTTVTSDGFQFEQIVDDDHAEAQAQQKEQSHQDIQ